VLTVNCSWFLDIDVEPSREDQVEMRHHYTSVHSVQYWWRFTGNARQRDDPVRAYSTVPYTPITRSNHPPAPSTNFTHVEAPDSLNAPMA
jgi:hypothetical protein